MLDDAGSLFKRGYHVVLQPRRAGDLIHLAMDDRMHAPVTVVACPREIFLGRRGAAGHLCYFPAWPDQSAASMARRDLCAATSAQRDMSAALAARRDISRAFASMLASPWWQSLDPELTLAMTDAREG